MVRLLFCCLLLLHPNANQLRTLTKKVICRRRSAAGYLRRFLYRGRTGACGDQVKCLLSSLPGDFYKIQMKTAGDESTRRSSEGGCCKPSFLGFALLEFLGKADQARARPIKSYLQMRRLWR